MVASLDIASTSIICAVSGLGILLSVFHIIIIGRTKLELDSIPASVDPTEATNLIVRAERPEQIGRLVEIYTAISSGAEAYLSEQYALSIVFMAYFTVILFVLITWAQESAAEGLFTSIAFILGACTSLLSGYIGMRVSVFSNARTALNALKEGFMPCFNTAFRAGSAIGLALTSLGVIVLYLASLAFRCYYRSHDDWVILFNCIAGYGLGGSVIALYGRVGGGIYTKAADVGADLVGKLVHGIPEDDPRNPAVVADLVGDNVGDVAGMGSDLFGSLAESTCAALVIGAHSFDLRNAGWAAVVFPALVASIGSGICLLVSFIPFVLHRVREKKDIGVSLRIQLAASSTIIAAVSFGLAKAFLPAHFLIEGISNVRVISAYDAAACILMGSLGGLTNGFLTEYYTSYAFHPVKHLAHTATTGPATEIIAGLSLGYRSCVAPALVLAVVIYVSFHLADMYGVSLAAVGVLSSLTSCLTIDSFGPVSDNAGGIAEIALMPESVRDKTDALDAAGNTTAAIGKGFAIGSASLVSLALYCAFVTRIRYQQQISSGGHDAEMMTVEVLHPLTFAFLVVGACLPYWFSSMTMRSVGDAAMQMIAEVERQFHENPDLLIPGSLARPDYARCVAISARASLREMMAPGALVILSPLLVGTFFGVYAVAGMLTGALLSAVPMAISMSNSGGAWDNAKKYIAAADPLTSTLGGKGSETHKSSIVCDTVGDPMKDTSGPSLNILMKLMAIISLVFAEYFYAINNGRGLFRLPVK